MTYVQELKMNEFEDLGANNIGDVLTPFLRHLGTFKPVLKLESGGTGPHKDFILFLAFLTVGISGGSRP